MSSAASSVNPNLVFPIQNDPFNQTSCRICLEDFKQTEKITQLACLHIYHSSCFAESIQKCPTCSFPLADRQVTVLPAVNVTQYLFGIISAEAFLLQLNGAHQNNQEIAAPLIQQFRQAHETPLSLGTHTLTLDAANFNSITKNAVINFFALRAAMEESTESKICLKMAVNFFQDPAIGALIQAHDEEGRAAARPLFENCDDQEILRRLSGMCKTMRSMLIFFYQDSNHALDIRVMRLNNILENEAKIKCLNKFLKILGVAACAVSAIWAGFALNRQ
jgi:hypothetical protein